MNKRLTELKYLADLANPMFEDDYNSDDIPISVKIAIQHARTGMLELQLSLMQLQLEEMSLKTD